MEEKKFFNLEKKITFSLIWLLQVLGFGWIVALVVLIADKTLDVEEKRELVSVIVLAALSAILYVTIIVPFVAFVFAIIACVKAFQGGSWKVPAAYQIAAAIIK